MTASGDEGRDLGASGAAEAGGGAGTAGGGAGRSRLWPFCLVAALAVSAAHGRTLSLGFVRFDDKVYVTENAQVLSGLTRESITWAFQLDGRTTYFHPLTWLSLMLDRELFGPGPLGFHAVNLVLHVAVAVLLLVFLAGATGRPWPSLAAVLLFAVHPLTVEGVAWIAERKLMLSSALGMGALVAYLAHARAPSWRRLAGAAALHAASLLAKPGLVILPALLLVLDFWPLRRLRVPGHQGREGEGTRPLGSLLFEKLPFAALSAASLAVSVVSVRSSTEPEATAAPFGVRVANAIVSVPRYLASALWPEGLSVFHLFPKAVPAAQVAGAALAVVAVTALAASAAAPRPWLLAGWLWFLVALSPYLGLEQAGMWPAWADRFAYLGLMGLALAASFEAAEFAGRGRWPRRAAALAGGAAIASLGFATWIQTGHWRDPEALYRRAVDVEPDLAVMRYELGTILAVSGRLDEAIAQLEAAVRIERVYPQAYAQLANAYRVVGRIAEAEAHYRAALDQAPDQPEALYNYADLLRLTGRPDEARPYDERFLRVAIDPRFAPQRALVERQLADGR